MALKRILKGLPKRQEFSVYFHFSDIYPFETDMRRGSIDFETKTGKEIFYLQGGNDLSSYICHEDSVPLVRSRAYIAEGEEVELYFCPKCRAFYSEPEVADETEGQLRHFLSRHYPEDLSN